MNKPGQIDYGGDMALDVFHVYRNTPLGRETLRQAADLVKRTGGKLCVYLPAFDRFLFHFDNRAVEVRLDRSYLYLLEQAEDSMRSVLDSIGVEPNLVAPITMTASNLPRLASDYDLLSLPRVMIERQGKLDIGAIGTGVRQIVKQASYPCLISPGRFHDWQEILVLFGGSPFAVLALKWGIALAGMSGAPLDLLTVCAPGETRDQFEVLLDQTAIDRSNIRRWHFLESDNPVALLAAITREACIVMGAYGHGRIRSRLFGSKTELVQKNTANLIVLIGEHCGTPPRE